jgi:hypothetical protein
MPRIEEHRVSVVFDCPSCHGERVRGTAYDLRETLRLAEKVPSWGWSSHWVRCSNCRAELHATCAAHDLQGASPATVTEAVHHYLPFPKRVLAVASMLLCWTPAVGLLLALVATALNSRTTGWPRWLSVVGLILSLAMNIAMLIYLLHGAANVSSPITPLAMR